MARQFPYNELSHITKKNSWNPEYEQEKKNNCTFSPIWHGAMDSFKPNFNESPDYTHFE